MRALIAGVLGGVSGGALVLAALVMTSGRNPKTRSADHIHEAGSSPITNSALQNTSEGQVSDMIADPKYDTSGIDGERHITETVTGIVEPALVTPKALTDAIATEHWRAYLRPAAADDAAPVAAMRALPEPAQSAAYPTLDSQVAQAPSPADGLQRDSNVLGAIEPALSDARMPGPVITAATSSDPPATSSTPASDAKRSAASEPEELRALRSFRLNVPIELPMVDLAVQAGSAATAARSATRASKTSTPTAPRTAAASPATTRLSGTVSRTPPSVATGQRASEAAAAGPQESLKRASDAVKRLSRRMGGSYVR